MNFGKRFFFFLLIIPSFSGCKEKRERDLAGKEIIVTIRKEVTPETGVIFTKKIVLDQTGTELFSFIDKTEFFSTQDPEKTKTEYTPRAWIHGLTTAHMEDILSPDKKWIVLKMGNVDGLVYCKAEDILEAVRENKFAGRFYFEFDYEDVETGEKLLTDAIGWEAPATFVFYLVDTDTDRKPVMEKDIYKINLETGEFTCPPQANPVIKPVLQKESAGNRKNC